MRKRSIAFAALACAATVFVASSRLAATEDDGSKILTIDHYVRLASKVPSIAGQQATIYVREKVRAGNALRGATPPTRWSCSSTARARRPKSPSTCRTRTTAGWQYLADAGFDTFSMDVTGIGRSTRPWPMNDPCNLSPQQQAPLVPTLIAAPCQPGYPKTITTIANDWDDIDAVVNYVRALRHVDKVSTVAWSQGGPRSGGYAAQHPEKINRQVMLAPAYNAQGPPGRRRRLPPTWCRSTRSRLPTSTRSGAVRPAAPISGPQDVHDVVWSEMLASDPVGATWGTGVRRAPARRRGAGTRRSWRRRRFRCSWCRACTTARFHRSASGSSMPITARRKRSSSILAVHRTTRCGRRTT